MLLLANLLAQAAASSKSTPSGLSEAWFGCRQSSAASQLQAMRELLKRSSDAPGSPPDPIFGIWFLNWRLYNNIEIPEQSFGEGLLAVLEPKHWDDDTRTYSVGMRDFTGWSSNANLAGLFNQVAQYASGFIQRRSISWGSDDQIVSITDRGVWPIIGGPRTFVNHWRATPINATSGTFLRTTGPDLLNRLTGGALGYGGGAYEYTAYKLFGRGDAPFPENIAVYQRWHFPWVWECADDR